MRFFALFFAALFFSTPLFAADNVITLEGKPHSSFLVGSTLHIISETENRLYRVNTSNNKTSWSSGLDNGPTRGLVYNSKIYITNSKDRTVSVFYTTGAYKTLSVVGAGPIGMVAI